MALTRFLFQNKKRIFLTLILYLFLWFSLGSFYQSNRNKSSVFDPLNQQSNSTFVLLLNRLADSQIRFILIDPDVLEHLFIQHLSFEKLEKSLITVGIVNQTVEKFLNYLHSNHWQIQVSQTTRDDGQTSIDHIFIEFKTIFLHFAVLYKQHSYYLIEPNQISFPYIDQLRFGDTRRAVEPSETEYAGDHYGFFYPKNVSHFLWLYKTSKFLHCNRQLADQMELKYNLKQRTSQLKISVVPMQNIAKKLTSLEKNYWLAGGTLLGWYRHCGLIPFTQDADFGLFAEEYDENIRNSFLGDPVTYLWGALGLVNDSLEFRLYTGRFTLDLFWAYRNGDRRWCGYQVHRAKFRRTLPLLNELCSCDLFGHRFSIPCDPESYLEAEYGKEKWKSPMEKNYTWVNMKYHSSWNDISWMYAVRLYTRDGKLRTDQYAIDWISDHFNYTLKEIPSFLNVVPNRPVKLPPLKTRLVFGTSAKKKVNRPMRKT